MPQPSPHEYKQGFLSENLTNLQLGLFRLHEALRRLNDHVQAKYADNGDDIRLETLADVNRTHARVEQLAKEAHLIETAHWSTCPRCHGDGLITQRGVLLQRALCPDCQGTGCCLTARAPKSPPALPRGRWQRHILTRLLALGGACWAVSLKRLWGNHHPSKAERAAFSCALRALEQGDLLRRTNDQALTERSAAVRRAAQVQLSPTGAAVAQMLTSRSKR